MRAGRICFTAMLQYVIQRTLVDLWSPSLESLVAQMIKNLPAMLETQVWSLGQENPLEKEMATTPAFLPGKFCGQRSLVGCCPWSCRVHICTYDWAHMHTEIGNIINLYFLKKLIVLYFWSGSWLPVNCINVTLWEAGIWSYVYFLCSIFEWVP